MWQYRAAAHRIIDGDTLVMNLDLGFNVYTRQHLRLSGFSAPERREEGGPEATATLTEKMLTHAGHGEGEWPFVVTTDKDKQTFTRFLAVSIVCGAGHDVIKELKVE